MDTTSRLSATIEIHSVDPGNEPLGEGVELQIRADGFHDVGGLGGGGAEQAPLSAEQVATTLLATFTKSDLNVLLSHLTSLQAAVMRIR